MKRIIVAAASLSMLAACAAPPPPASSSDSVCYQNFVVEGAPGVSNMSYRSWREFPGLVDQQRALNNLRAAMMAEGFSNVSVDAAAGALTAHQEHYIPSRSPVMRISARRVGAGMRVDAVFMLLTGQTSDSVIVRRNLCRMVDAANL